MGQSQTKLSIIRLDKISRRITKQCGTKGKQSILRTLNVEHTVALGLVILVFKLIIFK